MKDKTSVLVHIDSRVHNHIFPGVVIDNERCSIKNFTLEVKVLEKYLWQWLLFVFVLVKLTSFTHNFRELTTNDEQLYILAFWKTPFLWKALRWLLLSFNSFKKALRVFQINFKLRKTFTSCPKVVPSILKVSPVVFFYIYNTKIYIC